MSHHTLHTTAAYSVKGDSSSPDGDRVGVEEGGRELPVAAPPGPQAAHDGTEWSPEQLYAAAVASCLHQTLGVVGSETGADLSGSRVRAEVALSHEGALRYSFTTRAAVALPNVDPRARNGIVREAMRSCPVSAEVELVDP
ncbi:OsmC family protein [Streptomyces sp. NPDC006992]|uniref:OsmC family protein n=1 Tax=unclassified Streptomyces TaxID=2593676 RepID=UPI003406B669